LSLFELAYVSTASDRVSDADLAEIISQSQLNNAFRDISGVLLFNGSHFAQVLEGFQQEVVGLFEEIRLDHRHTDVTMISAAPIAARSFAGWSMRHLDDEVDIFGRDSRFLQALAVPGSSDRGDQIALFLDAVKQLASNQSRNSHI
jgi:hypothetical protein